MASLPYAYVFSNPDPDELPLLRKLGNGAHLSLLHAKYWGVSINQDESQWVGVHDQLMETDESEIVRGCFCLQLDIPRFAVSKLWVRKDYIRIYDHCDHHSTVISDNQLSPTVILTGQPGIGKTYWILYAARRRLGEAKPFLWCFAGQWYLFVEGGVFVYPEPFDSTLFVRNTWAFVDINETSRGFPGDLAAQQSLLFLILTTSPRQNRWKPLTTNSQLMTLIMNPWTWEEISKAVEIHMLTEVQRTEAQEVFLEYGPIPRFCIDFVKTPSNLETYRINRESAISSLRIKKLISVVKMGEKLDMDMSHSMILVKRETVDNLFKFTIEPISLSVRRLLRKQLMEAEQKERLRTYLLLSRTQASRILTGLVFESFAQVQLQKKVTLNLVPMVKVLVPGRGNDKWESQSSEDAGKLCLKIKFIPEETIEYNATELKAIKAGAFYVPMSSKQVAFDSFMLVGQVLYFFQFSIAASHDIKEGIMKFLSQTRLKETFQRAEWRFVFIIPSGSTMFCPESNVTKMKEFWDRANLFTAEIETSKRGQSQDGDSESANSESTSSGSESADVISHEPTPRPSTSDARRTSARVSAQKRKAQDDSLINEATSSKARPSGKGKQKARN